MNEKQNLVQHYLASEQSSDHLSRSADTKIAFSTLMQSHHLQLKEQRI
jgi:hypothetical protein